MHPHPQNTRILQSIGTVFQVVIISQLVQQPRNYLAASARLSDTAAVDALTTSAAQAHLGLHRLLGGLKLQYYVNKTEILIRGCLCSEEEGLCDLRAAG